MSLLQRNTAGHHRFKPLLAPCTHAYTLPSFICYVGRGAHKGWDVGRNEADTRAQLIDPAIHGCGWTEDLIRREETLGAIHIVGDSARRQGRGRMDYTLRVKVNPQTQPVAVALIEAKAEDLPPTHGLEQGKAYATAQRFHVPFVFSTNGHLFVEYDGFSRLTSAARPLSEFPTPANLRARYEQGMGFSLDDPAARPLVTPYAGGEATRRYYQDAAIRAVFERLARGETRALLSLATGAGKTFIAVNLLRRIGDAGQLHRALFICDRDELREQAKAAFHNNFGADAAPVYRRADGTNNAKNARIHVATYQTLGIADDEDEASFLAAHYPPGYFSHIVVDECHRSAWGKWSEVLRRNPDAVQIGLTATPRQIVVSETSAAIADDDRITADNIAYFGEPVYEYDIAQGIEDGYLAACEIQRGTVDIDDTGLTIDAILAHEPKDANTGQPLTRDELNEIYERNDYERKIMLPDRVAAMTEDLFNRLLDTGGPEQKTIIFCARDRHADAVAIALNNLYANWCEETGSEPKSTYAFKCAAAAGSEQLGELRDATRHHFIATTVDLLTTGVDVPCVRNVVFFKYVKSPISFHQMIGRGTRIDEASGKLMFRVYDYTNATRLFGEEFRTKLAAPRAEGTAEGDGPRLPVHTVVVQGMEVQVTDAGKLIVTMVDGKATPVTVEAYRERIAARLVGMAPTLDAFRERWVNPARREELLHDLPEGERSALLVRSVEEMDEYDLYDVLGEIGYGLAPRTRVERAGAFGYKHDTWLATLSPPAAKTLKALVHQFADAGTDGLENPLVWQTPQVRRAGGLPALAALGTPATILHEAKVRVFAV